MLEVKTQFELVLARPQVLGTQYMVGLRRQIIDEGLKGGRLEREVEESLKVPTVS